MRRTRPSELWCVVRSTGYGFEVIGIEDAGRGLMERRTVPLSIGLDVQGSTPC